MNTCQILFKSLIEEKQGEMVQSVQKKKNTNTCLLVMLKETCRWTQSWCFPGKVVGSESICAPAVLTVGQGQRNPRVKPPRRTVLEFRA